MRNEITKFLPQNKMHKNPSTYHTIYKQITCHSRYILVQIPNELSKQQLINISQIINKFFTG